MIRKWAFLFTALVACAGSAQAQPYPTRPIRRKLTEAWGQRVIVENRPGANGFLGVTAVSRAEPDGYTLLVATAGDVTINPVLFKKVPYDVGKDLVSITMLSD